MRTPTAILLTLTVLMVRAEATPPREAPGPVVLDQRVQLFIDDVLIERTERVWRTLNRVRKVPENPLIKSERPWEGYLILLVAS